VGAVGIAIVYTVFCSYIGNEMICTVTGNMDTIVHNYTNITNITHITQCNLQDGELGTDPSLWHTQNMFGNVSGAMNNVNQMLLVPNFLWVMGNLKPLMNKFDVVLGQVHKNAVTLVSTAQANAVTLVSTAHSVNDIYSTVSILAKQVSNIEKKVEAIHECCENNKQQQAQDDQKQDSEKQQKQIQPPQTWWPTSILNLLASIWSYVWIFVGLVVTCVLCFLCHIFPPVKWLAMKIWLWLWTMVCTGVKWVWNQRPKDKAETKKPVEEKPVDKPAKDKAETKVAVKHDSATVLPVKKVRNRMPMEKIKEDQEPKPAVEIPEELLAWISSKQRD